MNDHTARVSTVAAQVKHFHAQNTKFRIYHGATNSTRPSPRHREASVDTSRLDHVLQVDRARKIALVEPNCPMDKLLRATLAVGLLPPVVPEFPGITAGGGFAGTAGESSSFKYGFLDAVVNGIEIVLADGRIMNASPTENEELFYGAAGTLGTLGVLTLLEMQLIDAKAYVEVTYHRVDGFQAAVAKTQEVTATPGIDFVDGIMFSKGSGTIITGRLTDDVGGKKTTRFTRRHDPWFYLHAKKQISRPRSRPDADVTECIPLTDYLFRYDRGGFWVGALAFQYFHMPFDRVSRFLMDAYLHTRVMYHALHASGLSRQYIIEDLALPEPHAAEFMEYVDAELGIYPLWLCPLKIGRSGLARRHSGDDDAAELKTLLNVGVWGPGPRQIDDFVAKNRDLEGKIKELGGTKWFYAQAFYTEQEFWDIYDEKAYTDLREKYNATSLPSVYDKIKYSPKPDAKRKIWEKKPFPGLYGVWKVTAGGREYILTRKNKKTQTQTS